MILYIEYTNYIIKNNKYYGEIKREQVLKQSPGVGNGNSLQYSCLENSMEPGGIQSMESQRVGHD